MYIISPLTSQLGTASRKVAVKYVGPLAVYKIMTLDGRLLRGIFEHEILKPAMMRTNQGNVSNLAHLKQVITPDMLVQ